jgi:hypothetical protein
MWKKQDDAEVAQPHSISRQQSDAARLLGDVLSQSPPINENFEKGNLAVSSEAVVSENANQPLTSPTMETYTEALKEFTINATAFIEHLPLLSKARAAYEEAMRASTEMRRALDAGDENLRTLMTQLEQTTHLQELKSVPDKKRPEPAKVERMKNIDEGGGRTSRWP